MCFFPAGSAEAEKYFILYFSHENKAKNLEHKHHFFFAFKGRAQGEFLNNKPKLAITLITMKLLGRELPPGPGAGAGTGVFVPLLVNNSPLFT